MFSRRTRWSQHFQRMGTRYTSRCRGANNLDQFTWLMGDSPYYKFAPPTRRNFQILLVQKKTIIFLCVFSVSPLSTRVTPYFFFSCFPVRLYQKVHAQLGKHLQKDQFPDKLLLVNATWKYTKLHYDNCGHIVSLIVIMNGFEDYILSLSF